MQKSESKKFSEMPFERRKAIVRDLAERGIPPGYMAVELNVAHMNEIREVLAELPPLKVMKRQGKRRNQPKSGEKDQPDLKQDVEVTLLRPCPNRLFWEASHEGRKIKARLWRKRENEKARSGMKVKGYMENEDAPWLTLHRI